MEKPLPASFGFGEMTLAAQLVDISVGGAGVELVRGSAVPGAGVEGVLAITGTNGKAYAFHAIVESVFRSPEGALRLGMGFRHESASEAAEKVSLIYGDSAFWLAVRNQRTRHTGVRSGLGSLIHVSLSRCRELSVYVARSFRVRFLGDQPNTSNNHASLQPRPLPFGFGASLFLTTLASLSAIEPAPSGRWRGPARGERRILAAGCAGLAFSSGPSAMDLTARSPSNSSRKNRDRSH
ncbi:MAG: hypothetical protein R3F31_07150 [Verrucomicrobiales bacterium]